MSTRWLFALAALMTACRPGSRAATVPPEADSATVTRARQAAGALGQQLLGALMGALQEGGTEAALAFCADSAQMWSARHQDEGVTVRRTSLRVRNPANRPDSVERRILQRLAAAHEVASLPQEYREVVRLPEGGYALHLARPVVVQPACLACHGDPAALSPDVRRVLADRYPGDSATGYTAGDLRGMVSVRLRLPE